MDLSIWNSADLGQYFLHTYVGIEEEEKEFVNPCYIKQILDIELEGHNKWTRGFLGNSIEGLEQACRFDADSLRIIIPTSTFVNCEVEAVYMSRTTERQYKKGITDEQFIRTYVSAADVTRNILRHKPVFTPELVTGLFNADIFPNFYEAMDNISNGDMLSCAFHQHFAVAVKKNIPDMVLYYKGSICGSVKNEIITLADEFSDLQEKIIEVIGEHNNG